MTHVYTGAVILELQQIVAILQCVNVLGLAGVNMSHNEFLQKWFVGEFKSYQKSRAARRGYNFLRMTVCRKMPSAKCCME